MNIKYEQSLLPIYKLINIPTDMLKIKKILNKQILKYNINR